MLQVYTSTTRHPITSGSETLAREYYEAAKRSGRGAMLMKCGVVIDECEFASEECGAAAPSGECVR